MWLTHKLVELQGISEIFLSRTAWFFTAKVSYLAVEKLCRRFVLSLFVSSHLSLWMPVYFTWVFSIPLLIDRSTICHSSRLLFLFLNVVMDILWMWLRQKWGHLHVRSETVLTAGSFAFATSSTPRMAHLGRWPVNLVSTESHLNALTYLPLHPSEHLFSIPCGIFGIWEIFVYTWTLEDKSNISVSLWVTVAPEKRKRWISKISERWHFRLICSNIKVYKRNKPGDCACTAVRAFNKSELVCVSWSVRVDVYMKPTGTPAYSWLLCERHWPYRCRKCPYDLTHRDRGWSLWCFSHCLSLFSHPPQDLNPHLFHPSTNSFRGIKDFHSIHFYLYYAFSQ